MRPEFGFFRHGAAPAGRDELLKNGMSWGAYSWSFRDKPQSGLS
jgi:hypothetical protein